MNTAEGKISSKDFYIRITNENLLMETNLVDLTKSKLKTSIFHRQMSKILGGRGEGIVEKVM